MSWIASCRFRRLWQRWRRCTDTEMSLNILTKPTYKNTHRNCCGIHCFVFYLKHSSSSDHAELEPWMYFPLSHTNTLLLVWNWNLQRKLITCIWAALWRPPVHFTAHFIEKIFRIINSMFKYLNGSGHHLHLWPLAYQLCLQTPTNYCTLPASVQTAL